MTSFLVFIILVLVGIAVWQLTKIFDLTQIGGSSDNDEIAMTEIIVLMVT